MTLLRWLTVPILIGLLGVPAAETRLEAACIQGDCVTGMGVYTWPDGTRYEGGFRDTRFAGQGTYTWPDGRRYEGRFLDGMRHGQGVYTWPSGARYEGQWEAGRRHGRGTYRWSDGSRYDGQWAADAKNGLGINTYPDGSTDSGRWQDDVLVERLPAAEVARRLAELDTTAPAPIRPDTNASITMPPPSAPPRREPVAVSPALPVTGHAAALDNSPIQLQAEGQIVDGVGTNLTTDGGKTLVGQLGLGLVRRDPETINLTITLTNASSCGLQFEGWMMIGDVLERVVDWRGDQNLAPGASRRAEAVVVLPSNIEGLNLRFQPKGRLANCP